MFSFYFFRELRMKSAFPCSAWSWPRHSSCPVLCRYRVLCHGHHTLTVVKTSLPIPSHPLRRVISGRCVCACACVWERERDRDRGRGWEGRERCGGVLSFRPMSVLIHLNTHCARLSCPKANLSFQSCDEHHASSFMLSSQRSTSYGKKWSPCGKALT